jgi:glycosyltransferase involved in cell wall biosynthesis
MKVGLVIYGGLKIVSGGYLYDRMLVDHLRSQGHEVRVFSLPWRGYVRHLYDNFSAGLLRQLAGSSLDLLIQDELNHVSLFMLNRRLSRRSDLPIVSLVHHLRSDEPRNPIPQMIYAWVERRYLRSVNKFIYNSQSTRRSVERQTTGVRPCIVAYPGRDHIKPDISPRQIAQRASRSGPLRILFLGNITPRKGLHVLLAALEHFKQDEWRLDIIGSPKSDPRYAARIRSQMTKHRYSNRLHLHGAQSKQAVRRHLMRSHVMALPSYYEGFGIAYLESMGHGLPVIGTSAGGSRELIHHKETGFLIAPGDHEALSRHLLTLSANRSRLAEMGAAAQGRYYEHPTWSQSMSKIAKFLEESP